MTAGRGEGGVSYLRSDAFKGGEGARSLEVNRTIDFTKRHYGLMRVSREAMMYPVLYLCITNQSNFSATQVLG